MEETTHIAVVVSPGYSHLVPTLEFFKRVTELHHPHFHVTCILPTLGSPPSASIAFLQSLPPTITHTFLPPVDPNDLPRGLGVQIQLTVSRSLPFIREALKSLTSRAPVAALVVDNFAYQALDLANDFNMLSYVYFPNSALALSLYFYLPKLHEETCCEYRNLPEPIRMPGCVPLRGHDLHEQAQERSSQGYQLMLQRVKRIRSVDGIFINTFSEMESGPMRELTREGAGYPPMYPVGPIVQAGPGPTGGGSECLRWLDNQQPGSVLYVSFGSGGTLSQEQIIELALGLEMSNQRFLWVVRPPSRSSSAAFLRAQDEDPLLSMPSGFLERTREQGLVVPSWAPQIQILSHTSVGGFLSHSGWNSTLESVLHAVPLITWPLFAEQRTNAVMLTDALGVALRPKATDGVDGNGVVQREEVAEVVKALMESEQGGEMRKRMEELRRAAVDALKEDGSSTKTLYQSTIKWRNSV